MKKNIILLINLLFCTGLWAQQNAALDPTFGQGGFKSVHQKPFEAIAAIALQSDLKMVAVGFTESSTNSNIAVLRYLPDGSLDAEFGNQGVVLQQIYSRKNVGQAVAIQPDGKILVAGYFLSDQLQSYREDLFLLRLNPNGALDSTFSEDGILTRDFTQNERAMAVQVNPSGNIFLAANSFKNTNSAIKVFGFLPDGSPNPAFGDAGIANVTVSGSTWNHCYDMVMRPNGNLVLAVESRSLLNAGNFTAVQLLPTGLGDPSFSGDGMVASSLSAQDDVPMCVAVMPDGKVVLGGLSLGTAGESNLALVRFTAGGSLDVSFNSTGKLIVPAPGEYGEVSRLLVTPEGNLLAVGTARNDCQNFDLMLAKFDQNGVLDPGFGENGFVLADFGENQDGVNDALWLPDGKLMVAGSGVNMHRSLTEFLLARFRFGQNVGTSTIDGNLETPIVFPNPTDGSRINLHYTLLAPSEVTIDLFSISGAHLGSLYSQSQAPGLQKIELDLPLGLPKGQYLAAVQTATDRSFVKFILQ